MRFIGLACIILGVALAASGCRSWSLVKRSETVGETALVGMPAPPLEGEDFNGKRISLSDHRGKVVVVVFWATWCPPCRAMIPHEKELVARYRNRPFALIAVNNDSDHDEAREFIAAQKMSWPICKTIGTQDPINQRWGASVWPTICVVDDAGVVRYRFTGFVTTQLESAIETLLGEMNASKF